MEIAEKKLREILSEQQKQTEKYIDTRFSQQQERTEGYINTRLEEQQEQTERYVGGLKEDFDHKLDAIMEYVREIPEIKRRQEMLFEQVANLTVDIEIIKKTVAGHEEKIRRL